MKRFGRGLVIGKFCPLHRGHELLIHAALDRCDEVLLLSYTRPEFARCEPFERRRWFEARFPAGRLRWRVLDPESVDIPHNDDSEERHRRFCGEQCIAQFGCSPDAVFTSEDYGPGFAASLSARFGHAVAHVSVDPDRVRVPVSATQLRSDPFVHRAHVAPEVFAGLVPRIGVLGGESSGKTTLAHALAARYPQQLRYAAEYGRERWVERGGRLNESDLPLIAEVQIAREETLAVQEGCRWVIGDTTPLTTLFYCLEDFARAPPALHEMGRRHYDLLVLCEPDFDFVQDGTRRDEAFRRRQHAWYLERLAPIGERVLRVGGSVGQRVRAVADRLGLTA